jgi:hypothetical protein
MPALTPFTMNRLSLRTVLTVCTFTLGLAGVLAAEAPAPAPASAKLDAVLAKYVESVGGRAVIERITNSVSKGTTTVTGMELQLELARATPARMASRLDIPGMGIIREVCDGERAWTVNPFAGNTEKAGAELAKAKRDAVFQQPLRMKQIFPTLAYQGRETVANQPFEVLEARLAGDAVERFYFHPDTGWLVRRDAELETAQGRIRTQMWLEDYRAVDGLKQPHTLRLKVEAAGQPAMELQFKFTEIRQNVPLPDTTFAKPQ